MKLVERRGPNSWGQIVRLVVGNYSKLHSSKGWIIGLHIQNKLRGQDEVRARIKDLLKVLQGKKWQP